MIKKISKIIYLLLKVIDFPLKKIFNRSFLIWFKDFIEVDSYIKIQIPNSKNQIKLFAPNYLTNWMSREFFEKEPETIEWINNFKVFNDKKIIFWDIGANLGFYSIYAAKIHQNIDVVSFEPSSSNLRILSRNISINNLEDKIGINTLPLGTKDFKFSIFRESKFGEGESNNSYDKNIDFEGKIINQTNSYKLLGTSINKLIDLNILEIPNYIKIDVDGLEHIILSGASKCLSHGNLKGLQIEINENFADQYLSILEIMKQNNFKLISKKRNENLEIYKNKKFLNIYNYYFEK
tara:strand:- start:5023 stop:5901 length:879 start_codon:yes stop_codon:yes gene_type:complete